MNQKAKAEAKAKADDAFLELGLQNLFPSFASGNWPTEYMHQKTMSALANETMALLRAAAHDFRKLDEDEDLTMEAKQKHRGQIAESYIAKLEASPTYRRAAESVEYILTRYQAKIDTNLKPASDAQTVGVHQQIRSQLAAITDPRERVRFLSKHGNDEVLIAAALSAPPFVSGLDEGEIALLRGNLERLADQQLIKARDDTKAAWAECERGVRAARSRLEKRGHAASVGAVPVAKPIPNFVKQQSGKPQRVSNAPAWTDNDAA